MTSATVSHKLLGQLLVERGLLPEDDLQKALQLQRERKGRLGRILLDLGYISQRTCKRFYPNNSAFQWSTRQN